MLRSFRRLNTLLQTAALPLLVCVAASSAAEAQSLTASDGLRLDRVEIRWTTGGAVGYSLTRDGTTIASPAATATTYTDFGATPGTTHTYCITGGGLAAPVCDDGSLGAVEATDDFFEDRVEVSWPAAADDASLFKVYRTEGAAPTGSDLIGVAASTQTSYTDRSGRPGTTYTYWVSVATGATESPWVLDTGRRILFPPTGLRATDGTLEDRVDVAWADRSQVEAGYVVSRDGAVVATLPANTSFWSDTLATPGQTYTYTVAAYEDTDRDGAYTPGTDALSASKSDPGSRGFVLPPRAFAATDGQYPDRVVLTWIDPTDLETGTRITRDGVEILPESQTATFPRNETVRYEDTGATPGTTHTYCATTLSPAGESVPSCDTGGLAILPAPADVAASDDTFDARVLVTWQDVSDTEDAFRIYRDGTLLDSTAANVEQYRDDTATPGTTHTYCVAALSQVSGTDVESAQVCDAGRRIPVLAPTAVKASDNTYEGQVELTWTDPSEVAALYKVYRTSVAAPRVLLKTLAVGQRLHLDTQIESGTLYSYCVSTVAVIPSAAAASTQSPSPRQLEASDLAAVRASIVDAPPVAFQSLSPSALQEVASALSLGDLRESEETCDIGSRALLAPTSVAATFEKEEAYVEVTWQNASAIATGHRVYRDGALAGEVRGTQTTFRDTGGQPGQAFPYTVLAFDAHGLSAPSPADEGKRTLIAPTDLTVRGPFEDRVELAWTDRSRAETGYRVYRKRTDGTDRQLVAATGVRAQTATDTALDFGVPYVYVVVAFDAIGESDSATVVGRTVVPAPGSVSASRSYFDQITVTWVDRAATETAYRVRRVRVGATDTTVVATLGASSGQFIDTNAAALPLDVDFAYCVSASTAAGARTAEVCATGRRDSAAQPVSGGTIQPQKLTCPEGGCSQFGREVAASGPDALVTRSFDRMVFFSRNASGAWGFQQALAPNPGNGATSFGGDVALAGTCAAIGSPNDDNGNGVVSFYTFNGTSWVHTNNFVSPGNGEFGQTADWGTALAYGGGRGIAGSGGYDRGAPDGGSGFNSGAASFGPVGSCAFNVGPTYDISTFDLDLSENDGFGTSVDIDATYAIIGAPQARNFLGDAYIFNGSTLEAREILPFSARQQGIGQFGRAVGIAGRYAVIGAGNAAFLFRRNDNGSWVEAMRLTPPVLSNDDFGVSVAIVDNHLIVGASAASGGQGAVHIWERDPAQDAWFYSRRLDAAGAGLPASSSLGRSVAIADGTFVVGSNDGVYTFPFDFIPPPTPSTIPQPGRFQASDGLKQDAIQLRWSDETDDEVNFKIYRNDRTEPIATIEPNLEVYNDVEAVPGQAYIYCIETVTEAGASEKVCDGGLRPSNGTIGGQITYRSISGTGGGTGVGVPGAQVCLSPNPNGVLLLDGVGGAVEVPNASAFQFGEADSFTLEAWVKYGGTAGPGTEAASLVEAWTGRETGYPIALRTVSRAQSGQLTFSRQGANGTATVQTTRTDLADTTWHHVAVVHDGPARTLTLYVDGVQDGTASSAGTGDTRNTSPLYFGRRGTTTENHFGGQLDEVRLWSRVRTPAEIASSMATPLVGDESGLVGYWPLDLRSGTVVADLSPSGAYGALQGGAFASTDASPLQLCATTDSQGNYTLDRLSYGASTAFTVTPTLENRQFEPVFKTITLSTENAVQNEVAYNDVTGYIAQGTVVFPSPFGVCPAPGVDLYASRDGNEAVPMGTSESDGSFTLSLRRDRYSFDPRVDGQDRAFANVPAPFFVDRDTTLAPIEDRTTRTLSGFFGGSCMTEVGTAELRIFTEDGCFDQTLPLDGDYTVDLPPQKYLVQVVNVDPTNDDLRVDVLDFFEGYGTREVDLTAEDQSLDFIYRAPLRVDIAELAGGSCATPGAPVVVQDEGGDVLRTLPSVPILLQGTDQLFTIRAVEDYGDPTTTADDATTLCPVDTGTLSVFDGVADGREAAVELAISDGEATYATTVGSPDFLTGRRVEGVDRSFQKPLTVVARVEGRPAVTESQWVLVEGRRARESTFVSATTDPFPVKILRDPPGSTSYAYMEEGKTTCSTLSNMSLRGGEAGIDFQIGIGFAASYGVFVETEVGAGVGFKTRVVAGRDNIQDNALEVCTTATERLSTSADPGFAGEDLFTGVALNLVFALADQLDADRAACTVTSEEVLAMDLDEADPFETAYVYGSSHIQHSLIPALNTLIELAGGEVEIDGEVDGDDERITLQQARNNWARHLSIRDTLSAQALRGTTKNRSFSSGADYEYAFTSDTTRTTAQTTRIYTEIGGGVGALLRTGFDTNLLAVFDTRIEDVSGQDSTRSNTVTTGYVLSDGDTGDFFSVDVGSDPRYGTPVFGTVSGRSSNPWEPGTQKRDSVVVEVFPPLQENLDPNAPATVTVSLSNASESKEAREYALDLVPGSNPSGLKVTLNGGSLSSKVYLIQPDSTQEITLQLERGPDRFRYEDIALIGYPETEYQIWKGDPRMPFARADTARFSVVFETPCSEVRVREPIASWTVNQMAYPGGLHVSLDQFRLDIGEGKRVNRLGAQYRRAGTDDAWQEAFSLASSALAPDATSTTQTWDLAGQGIADGDYELRGFTECATGTFTSPPTPGRVDTTPPTPFGPPSPADEVLAFGGSVLATFDEALVCDALDTDGPDANTVVTYADGADGGTPIDGFRAACDEKTIRLDPVDPATWAAVEGRLLRATVDGLTDAAGNPLPAPLTWPFTVRRNAFRWTPAVVASSTQPNIRTEIQAALVNGRPQPVTYELVAENATGLPFTFERVNAGGVPTGETVDVTTSALSGTVVSGAVQPVVLRWPGGAAGTWRDTIQVESREGTTSLGRAPLVVTVDVSCSAPAWDVIPAAFEENMTITATLEMNGAISDDANDRLAAFVDGEVRGVGIPEMVTGFPTGRVTLQVYGTGAAEVITFQAWDDDQCTLHETTSRWTEFGSAPLGTLAEPFEIVAPGMGGEPLTVPLVSGWTWVSTNRTGASPIASALVGVGSAETDRFQSQTQVAQFVPGTGWVGELAGMEPGRGYRAFLRNAATLTHPGTPVDVATPLPVLLGWNWIGYLPSTPLPPDTALASLNATTDDQIKGQEGFADYIDGMGWVGSLEWLRPGLGYQLRLNADDTLIYPRRSPARAGGGLVAKGGAPDSSRVARASAARRVLSARLGTMSPFEHSMTVAAQLDSKVEGLYLAAFARTEDAEALRGLAPVETIDGLDGARAFLLIAGAADEEIHLRAVTLGEGGALVPAEGGLALLDGAGAMGEPTVTFAPDARVGTAASPARLQEAEVDGGLPLEASLARARPNPVAEVATLAYAVPEAGRVRLVVYDVLGREVRVLVDDERPAGHHEAAIDGRTLAAGTYVIRLQAGDEMRTQKLTVVR